MPRQKQEIVVIHASADYYEPLFRARFVRAMKALQKQVSIHDLAGMLHNARQVPVLLPVTKIEAALQPIKKVSQDAFMRGGKLGAVHVQSVLNAKR